MDEFKINMTDIVTRAQNEARASFERQASGATNAIIRQAFSDGRYNGPEGLAHEIIRKKVEELILSDDFSKLSDQIVARVIEEETERAVRALVNSKARKHLFQSTSPVPGERIDPENRLWFIQHAFVENRCWDNNRKDWTDSEDYTLYNKDEKFKAGLPVNGSWKISELTLKEKINDS